MRHRTFDDVVQIEKPEPDHHYRLIPCDCESQEVVYAQYIDTAGALMWRVVCIDCGATVDIHTNVKHQAQLAWNTRRENHGKINSKNRRYDHIYG